MGTLLAILAGTPASAKTLPRHVETHCDCTWSDSSDGSVDSKRTHADQPKPPGKAQDAP